MFEPFTLIICTHMRPKSLLALLESVKEQALYPNEILIIDGSTNNETEIVLKENTFENLFYFKVDPSNRGLTKQRNYGINLTSKASEIVCFLDDDVVLKPDYFDQLLSTYIKYPKALAAGGYITNEVDWEKSDEDHNSSKFYFDNWMRKESSRFKIRHAFGLNPDRKPGFLPTFAHGRSISYLPPSGKIYPVEFFMGGVSSYKKKLFNQIKFSLYFEDYGLYEDLDFCLRASNLGELYVNTSARLAHYHEEAGRPNKFTYGKMVVRNNWYVWRVKYPHPLLKSRLKWNLTAILLIFLRSANIINTNKKREAFAECIGRITGLLSLIYNKPKVE